MTPILTAENISGGYQQKIVIRGLHFDLQQGEWLSLLGSNGSGKSTLLRLIGRLISPQGGIITLDGKAIHHQSPQAIAQKLAFLPQQQTIPPGLTVTQLVSLGRSPHQDWWQWSLTREDQTQVDRALELTKLSDFADRAVENLSGGERQRVFLALALAQNPQVLLLDEPTTYLDLRYQLELLELLKNLQKTEGLSIITVLHEINLATRYSDRILLLKNGSPLEIGTPSQVINPKNLAEVFAIDAITMDTPVGLQICPLCPLT